jgi:hypothetical protein
MYVNDGQAVNCGEYVFFQKNLKFRDFFHQHSPPGKRFTLWKQAYGQKVQKLRVFQARQYGAC